MRASGCIVSRLRRCSFVLILELCVFFLGCVSQCTVDDDPSSVIDGELFGDPPCCHPANVVLLDGRPVMHEISTNASKLYFYSNFNATVMNQPDGYRKMIISLEPCVGVVYLFARRTRRCWPQPFTCCTSKNTTASSNESSSAPPCNTAAENVQCDWTHFHSKIDDTADGSPTFFEVPMTSTKVFFSVFAPYEPNAAYGLTNVSYRLTVLTDIGAYPRPGLKGYLQARASGERSVELSWEEATFLPMGVSSLKTYQVYSSLLLANERKVSTAVLLNPSKIMNSVCGLEANAVPYGEPLTPSSCTNGICTASINDIIPGTRYVFNVVSNSHRTLNSSYSGIVTSLDWSEQTELVSHNVTGLLGTIFGTVFGVIVIGYLWIVKLYS